MGNLNALLAEEASLTAEKAALEAARDQLRSLLDFNAVFERVFPSGAASLTQADFQAFLDSIQGGLPEGLPGLEDMDAQSITGLLEQAREAIRTLIAVELDLQSIEIRQMTLSAMKPQLEAGLKEAQGASEKLEAGKITMAVELAKAEVQMQNGLAELDKGMETFEQSSEEALANADLTNIFYYG